jgi:hypothetical protein
MDWQTICEQHPHNWVIVEAIKAYTEGAARIIDELDFVRAFGEDWTAAWEHYKKLHHADKQREYYVLHTNRENLNIGVMDSFRRIFSVAQ